MLYSQTPLVRKRQIAGDIAVAAWCVLWFYIGRIVHNVINDLALAGQYIANSGDKITGTTGGISAFGQSVASPLSSVGKSLSNAGSSQVHTVHHIAFIVGLLVALGPSLPVLIRHVVVRSLWIKVTQLLADKTRSKPTDSLLAQRALAHQPLDRLLKISVDPVGDVNRGNYRPYADLERNSLATHHR